MKTLRAFLRMPPDQRTMALEAALALLLARWLVAHVKMRRWRRLLDTAPEPPPATRVPPSARNATSDRPPAARPEVPRTVGAVVRKVARRRPFHARCLPRAMATQWLLRRRGIRSRLTFGVRRNDSPERPLEFHAWLTVAGQHVVGGAGAESYTPLPPPGPGAPRWPEPTAFGVAGRCGADSGVAHGLRDPG